MKRHDTHLLSDESEKESQEEEDAHQYIFTKSSDESNISYNNNISKEVNKKTPVKLILENNNRKNNNDNNDSIISSSELADIFRVEVNNTNVKYKKKTKSKPKKKNFFVKLKKVRLNKDNEDNLVEYSLTYNPTPNYASIIDSEFINIKNKINQEEKNDNKNKEKNINSKVYNTEQVIKNLNNKNKIKKINNKPKEKEILYFFYKDDNEGSKNLKRVINIINKEKSQLFKISNKNCFTLKNTNYNLISKSSQKINQNPFMENYNYSGAERYDKKREKMNYSAKNKLLFKKNNNSSFKENSKNNNLNLSLQNQHKIIYYKQSMSNMNNKNPKEKMLYDLYCGKNDNSNLSSIKRKRIKSTDSLIARKKMQQMQMQKMNNYNNYNNNNYNNNNYSNNNIYNNNISNMNMHNNIMEREEFYPEYIRYMEIHNREKENRKIIKNMFRKAGASCYDFNRHVGNDANCPICQMMQMKNENSIKIKGIRPIVSSTTNNSTQNSWQNRRIYSALSRILTKRQGDRSGSRSTNMSHTLNINKSQKNNGLTDLSKISSRKFNSNFYNNINNNNNNYNKNNNKKENNGAFRKLNINKSAINQNKFPKTNKVINLRNNNIKYN